MVTITICGGGGLGHTCAAMFSQQEDVMVNMLTHHPERWNKTFHVNTPKGIIMGRLTQVTDKPEEVVPISNIILLCLPAFLVEKEIIRLRPYLSENTILGTVVSSSGFFLFCHQHLPHATKSFGLQRVPYISRVVEYGSHANLLGFRDELLMAIENINDKEGFCSLCQRLFAERVHFVDSFYEVTLSNSNPILHTGRLYTMWKDWNGNPFSRCSLFYKEWTDEASEIEMKMDEEFFSLLNALKVNSTHIDTLLAHYEATDASSMTRKIQSIEAFSNILSPMKRTTGGWFPDIESRYFTEDFPFGLRLIWELAHKNGVNTPTIDKVYEWGIRMINQRKER